MKKSILLLFVALLPLVASAEKVEIDGIWYNLVAKVKQAEATFKGDSYDSYSGEYSGSITIPATVTHNGVEYSVTSIGERAFYECRSLAAITIPEGVTNIGESAFEDCGNLTAITIPENSKLTSIGNSAFWGCSSLTSITIPEGVTSIGNSAFFCCSSLAAITIPEGVTSIGVCAFDGCSSLTAITLPEGVTSIGERAFCHCSFLTTITIPEGVTSIGDDAFSGCSSLTAVHISSFEAWCNIDFSSPHANPLYYAKNLYINGELVTELAIPNSVTAIKDYAFSYCSFLTAITLPEGVTSIGGYAFEYCSSLTAITIPEGVTSIERAAFSGCSSLTTITLPEGVTSIGGYAFSGCSSLATITLPKSVTSIGGYAFKGCSNLTEITIPDGVTMINSQAFYSCSSLTTIVLPGSVSYISNEAFAGCPELLDVYCYAESVPSTENNAFNGSYPEYVTLHVPTSALADYKATDPWSSFGKFETMSIAVTSITLSLSSDTITEGESLTLTAMVAPSNADDQSISWSSSNPSVATVDNDGKVTAIAKGTATITAIANDGSGVSASCEVTVQELILGKCATPVISYKDGEVTLTCDTEGVTFVSETTENVAGYRNDTKFAVIPTYTLTAYATKEKYEDSDVATLTLCWVPCSEKHESEETSILTIPSKPVLISARDGVLTLSGLAEGTEVTLYTTDGTRIAHQQSSAGEAKFTVDTNQVYLVHIGDKVVKIGM